MNSTVFVSHAGADWPQVQALAAKLRAASLTLLLDREELDLGDSFLTFMERSLRRATHCLLLWSAAADASPWVQVEWEAAFHRTITESQRFLLIGLLDEHPVPQLLRPRLQCRLFPDLQSGVERVIEMCRQDERAEHDSGRAVRAPRIDPPATEEGLPVYISSELFGRTFPYRLPGTWPAALAVDRLVAALGLPLVLDHEGRVGLRFKYRLSRGSAALVPELLLAAQGVQAHDLLWLGTEVQPYTATKPDAGDLANASFRGASDLPPWAAQVLKGRVRELGLGLD
jgi:hypothetical protein